MKIVVNGEEKTFDNGITLADIIEKLGIADKVMAAAVNMEVVKKDNWSSFVPKDGDKIELLHFVGGG
ncbi:sulfur carrier protein ThiS [Hydrogenimonas thermophila]|uniref:Sulfur carrier protein n=1 Tax=Hydrogenimonas thermophila TaxID=223786 RepID=A0A1I5U7B8_9BACT|nr:sulfur carrier protein ThiS [Hydrogenimonas thermophila]WOE68860.1 sulfur carrier protein ThiS [Hydrogenimonas thermophila]WOE71368.1 sulfur carrier protein ThiS [Hydrogenimonas thermophila]SFP90506.1 sulfur carrier protein [Hydrogenimonas thermophila]